MTAAAPWDPGWTALTRRAAPVPSSGQRSRSDGSFAAGLHRWRWGVVAALALGALGFGVAGFRAMGGGAENTWADALYRSLRLFTLDGPERGDLSLLIEAARFLAPLATASTGLAAFLEVLERLRRLGLRRVEGHVVVCGLGNLGTRLAEDFLDEGRRVVGIERDATAQNLEALRSRGASVIVGDAADEHVMEEARTAHADVIVAACADDATNAEIAVQAFRVVRSGMGVGPAPRRSLRCYAHVADPDLRALVRRRDLLNDPRDAFELRLFNLYESAARQAVVDGLSRTLTRRRGADQPAHLVLVGLGPLGEAVLVEAARMPHREAAHSLRVTAIDGDADRRGETIRRRFPGMETACSLRFDATRIDDAAHLDDRLRAIDAEDPVSVVVLCVEERRLAIAYVLAIQARCAVAGTPVIVYLAEDRGLSTLLGADEPAARGAAGGLVRSFGAVESVGSKEAVIDEALDSVARTIHEGYVEQERARGKDPAGNPSMVAWSVLPETLRDSNRRQADHLPFKLNALGLWVEPVGATPGEGAAFTPEEEERLAILEHARWCAERRLEGWTHAPGKKDVERRTTPHLVGWDALSEDVKDYDREAVRGIPRILHALGLRLRRPG